MALLAACGQSSCQANDLVNALDVIMKNMSENPPATRPKNYYPQQQPAQQAQPQPQAQTSQVASAPVGDFEKYKQLSFADSSDLKQSVNALDVTAMLSSQHNGVVASADVKDEYLKGRVELPWYNNNYIVWNMGMGRDGVYYSQEFDTNKDDKAFVVIIKPDSEYPFFTVLEYMRKTDTMEFPLTTSLLYYPEAKAAFLYDGNKNLLAYKFGDKVEIQNSYIVKNSTFLNTITAIFDRHNK